MDNKDKKYYINLRNKDNIDFENENLTLSNGNYKIIKEGDNNEEFHYIYNNIDLNKNILPIQNKKRLIKKDNNFILNQKIENEAFKRKQLGIIKRAKNYQLYISTSGGKKPNFTINTESNQNKSFSQNKNLLKRDNIKLLSNKYIDKNNIKNNNINIYNYNNKNLKIRAFQQSPKNKGYQIYNKKNSLPKETFNENNHNCNILKANDINYNNFEGNISNNNYKINLNNQKKIFRSPPSYNSKKFIRKITSPLRRNLSKEEEFNDNIIKINDMDQKTFNQKNTKKHYADNYNYHEIIHYNSPKKTLKTIDNYENEQNCQYVNKNKIIYIINNNNNDVSQNSLRYYQSARKIPFIKRGNFTQLSESSKPIIVNKYLNDNHQSCNEFFNEINGVNKNNISYNNHTIENYEDNLNAMYHFGEQMLKKDKNYNIEKSLNQDISDKYRYQDEEEMSKIKIPLRKDKSYNNIIIKDYNENSSMKSLPYDNSYNEDRNIIRNGINKDCVSLNISINRNRLNHNNINRKKVIKPVKSKEDDIFPYKKENNINDFEDKINFCESIFDDKSIIDIIEEFEKEIEIEEIEKNKKNKKDTVNDKQSDNLILSTISDKNFGNESQNLTKSTIKKKHYYKTKNIDMEKNYDFMIYPTKKDKSQQK